MKSDNLGTSKDLIETYKTIGKAVLARKLARAKPAKDTMRTSAARSRCVILAFLIVEVLLCASFAQAQTISTIFGAAGTPTAGMLNTPSGVASDPYGNFYIADTNNCVVWKVSADGQKYSIIAGQVGTCTFPANSVTNSMAAPRQQVPAESTTLRYPTDVAFCNGTLYILDNTSEVITNTNNTGVTTNTAVYQGGLHQVDSNGFFNDLINPNVPNSFSYSPTRPVSVGVVQPQAIACDSNGTGGNNLYIQSIYTSQDGSIYSLDAWAADGTSSNLGELLQGVGTYLGVAAHFVSNSGGVEHRVYTLNVDTLNHGAIIEFDLGLALGVQGGRGFYTAVTQPILNAPTRITADGLGNLYVNESAAASSPSPTVDVVEIPQGITAGTGSAGFNGDRPVTPPSVLQLNNPLGIAASCAHILIADSGNNRIRSISGTPPLCQAAVTLTLSASGQQPASTLNVGVSTLVTLTASATINSQTATGGSVSFYDGNVLLCTVQVVSQPNYSIPAGYAVLTKGFGAGIHNLTAVYTANLPNLTAVSSADTLTVSGSIATQTVLSAQPDGSIPSNFDFSGTVFAFGFSAPQGTLNLAAPASTVGSPATLAPAAFPPNGLPNTFLTATQFVAPFTVAAAGDLNGDGIPDLVVFDDASSSGTTFGVLYGNGDGTFQPEQVYCICDRRSITQHGPCAEPLAFGPRGAFIADTTGGGENDVIILASYYSGLNCPPFDPFNPQPCTPANQTQPGSIPNPGGVFTHIGLDPNPVFSTGFSVGSATMTIGDVNNDGLLDLILTSSTEQTVTVLLGNGDARFTPASIVNGVPVVTSYSVPGASQSVIADFNHDGNPDIVTTSYLAGPQINIMLGNGDGTFAAPVSLTFSNFNLPLAIVATDLNGDGWPDLIVGNAGSPHVSVLLNNQNWSGGAIGFDSPTNFSTGPAAPETLALGDFNGDGYVDLFTGNADNSLSVLLSNGSGDFQAPQNFPSLGGSLGMVEADFNGDSVPDLAVDTFSSPYLVPQILLGGAESSTSTGSLDNLAVPGSGATQVSGFYLPNPNNWSASTGNTTVRGTPALAQEILSITPPSQRANPNSNVSFQVLFTPAANAPSSVPAPTGTVTLTATLGNQTVSTPSGSNNPYLVGFCYAPAFATGCPVTIPLPTAGTWTITASYAGDSNWAPAMSLPATFTVVVYPTSLSFSNPNPTTAVSGTTFVADVQFQPTGGQVPTGNVNFTATSGAMSVTIPSQSAATLANIAITEIPINFPSLGTWTIQAGYPGDAFFAPAFAVLIVNVTTEVCPSGTVLSISSPSNVVGANQQLQLSANVAGVPNPIINWTVSPTTAGSISPTGLFTAGKNAGVASILATVATCGGTVGAVTTVIITSGTPPPVQAATPTFSLPPGMYSGPQTVALTSTEGAKIFYTTDGSQPTENSNLYTGTISVTANETITALAGGTGFTASPITAGRYSIFAQAAQLLPGTLSTYISAQATTAPTAVAFDASGNTYVLDSGGGTITEYTPGNTINGTVLVPSGNLSNPEFFTVGVDGQTLFVGDYGNNRIVAISQSSSGVAISPITLTNIPTASTTCPNSPGAKICQPNGIFADPNGFLYVVDSGYSRILKLTPTGVYVSTVLDSSMYSQIHTLGGVAVDNAGNVYVANAYPGGVSPAPLLLIPPSGPVVNLPLVGLPLQAPFAVAVDPSGNVYVSDMLTRKVHEYVPQSTPSGGPWNEYLLTGGTSPLPNPTVADSGDGGPAPLGNFMLPLGITLDSNYNVYIADLNQQTTSGGSIRQINVSQGLWNYGATVEGQSSTQLGVLLNPTGTPLTISSINVTGINASDFTALATTPSTLPPGSAYEISMTFTPSLIASETATVIPTELFGGTPSSLTQSFTLNGMGTFAQTTTSVTAPAITYGNPVSVTVSVNSSQGTVSGNVSLSVDNGAPITQSLSSGSTVFSISGLGAGSHTLSANYTAQGGFGASSATGTLQVNQATPTLSINNIPSNAVFGGSFTPAYAYTGDGTPSVTSSTSASCTVSGGVVNFVHVGTCTLTAQATAGTNYAAVTGSPQSFTIGQATTTINISNLPSNAAYAGSFTTAYAYTGDGTPSVTSNTTSTCTVSGTLVNFVRAGICTLTSRASAGTNYAAVTGSLQSFTIGQATTTISINNIPSNAVYGGSFTPTYVYSGDGTLSVTSNTPSICASSGVVVAFFSAGVCTLTANASVGTNYAAATGSPQSFTIALAGTKTTLVSSNNPQIIGQPVTFTATVFGQFGGAATGSIVFKAGTTTLGTKPVSGNQAIFTTSFATAGTRLITAQYIGDSNNLGSTSSALRQPVVAKFATTTTLTSSLNPSFTGEAATFTATVNSAGGAPPDGEMITFKQGAASLGTAFLVGGSASFPISTLAVGTRTTTASYAGDATFSASNSAGLKQVVDKYPTNTSLTSSLNPSTFGQAVTLTATVTSSGPSTPTGNVVFRNGTTVLATKALANGVATIVPTNLPAGTLSISATYKGDTASATSVSPALTQIVYQAVTTTTVVSSKNPSTAGQSVKFTATVTSPTTTPTGTVTFTAGSVLLGTVNLAGGKASITTSTLTVGSDTITATYNGDGTANILGSSGSVAQTVQ